MENRLIIYLIEVLMQFILFILKNTIFKYNFLQIFLKYK